MSVSCNAPMGSTDGTAITQFVTEGLRNLLSDAAKLWREARALPAKLAQRIAQRMGQIIKGSAGAHDAMRRCTRNEPSAMPMDKTRAPLVDPYLLQRLTQGDKPRPRNRSLTTASQIADHSRDQGGQRSPENLTPSQQNSARISPPETRHWWLGGRHIDTISRFLARFRCLNTKSVLVLDGIG